MRVLIVEDSRTQAAMLHSLLEGEGYAVTVAATGEEGLHQVGASKFDVVISDVVMPGSIDGYELCQRIKAGPSREVPVVLLTSLSDPLDIIRGLECGADNFLTKPYEGSQLLGRLKTLLSTRATRTNTKLRMGVEVFFMGREFTITSEREQILDLLVSTFEDAVRQNRELREREEELESARQELARYAGSLQARLQQVLASTPAVIYATRMVEGRFVSAWVSENVEKLTGFSAEEATAPTWWKDHLHPEDRTRIRAELPAIFGRGHITLEYRFRRKDGTYLWVRDDSRLVEDRNGGPPEVVGAWVDITEERRLEEQLRLAQKMEAIGTLAGGVAHDFNNMLAIIKSTVDLVQTDLDPASEARADLQDIADTVTRATALTRQLLAFGRKQVLEPRPLDLGDLLAGTLKMVERIMGEDVRLVLHRQPGALAVQADPGQIEQVLLNLCANARDAMPGGGEVTISTSREVLTQEYSEAHSWARPGDYAVLTVADTGSGMDAATQARVFEPFFTTKEMGRGTGLGLAVVYGIIKQHGGLIHLYSAPSKGTTFRIFLPLHSAAPEPLPTEDFTTAVGGSETILLAEDDSVLRATATRLLERLGYQVVPVASGEEALEALARYGTAIQALVVDVVMPRMSGRQVFDEVKARYPALAFVFTTGYSPATSHMEPIRTLPAEVLQKPYGLQSLARAVCRALDGSGRDHQPKEPAHPSGAPAPTRPVAPLEATQGKG